MNGNSPKSSVGIAPPWLEPLLLTKFFAPCNKHEGAYKNECNHYCLDCRGPALCLYCSQDHKDHNVIQIRRSSYHDVIRVSEIQKALDLTGIQTYIINSARVVFIKGRPQLRQGKGVTNNCRICDRSLLDSYKFCSLGCKWTGITMHHKAMSFLVKPTLQTPLSFSFDDSIEEEYISADSSNSDDSKGRSGDDDRRRHHCSRLAENGFKKPRSRKLSSTKHRVHSDQNATLPLMVNFLDGDKWGASIAVRGEQVALHYIGSINVMLSQGMSPSAPFLSSVRQRSSRRRRKGVPQRAPTGAH